MDAFVKKRKPNNKSSNAIKKRNQNKTENHDNSKRKCIDLIHSPSHKNDLNINISVNNVSKHQNIAFNKIPIDSNNDAPLQKVEKLVIDSPINTLPKRNIQDMPYYKDLERLEIQDDNKNEMPYSMFSVEHYEPRGIRTDRLSKHFGKSPRAVFNQSLHRCHEFQHVWDNYIIPDKFDTILGDFGTRSGMCFEGRVLRAYRSGLLQRKKNSAQRQLFHSP